MEPFKAVPVVVFALFSFGGSEANASQTKYTLSFSANDFRSVPPVAAPFDPISGLFTFSLDPFLNYVNWSSPFVINSLGLPALDTVLGVSGFSSVFETSDPNYDQFGIEVGYYPTGIFDLRLYHLPLGLMALGAGPQTIDGTFGGQDFVGYGGGSGAGPLDGYWVSDPGTFTLTVDTLVPEPGNAASSVLGLLATIGVVIRKGCSRHFKA